MKKIVSLLLILIATTQVCFGLSVRPTVWDEVSSTPEYTIYVEYYKSHKSIVNNEQIIQIFWKKVSKTEKSAPIHYGTYRYQITTNKDSANFPIYTFTLLNESTDSDLTTKQHNENADVLLHWWYEAKEPRSKAGIF